MFGWFSETFPSAAGLEKMRAEFGQMLDAGSHIFAAASNALLGGTELAVIRRDLFDTDVRINRSEQQIRREIVVHASVHGATSFPACLILMSVVKDAERVGDYAKNIFDLAETTPAQPSGEQKEDLVDLKDKICKLMADCREAFDKQSSKQARELIRQARVLEDHCDERVEALIREQETIELSATYVLAYRYFKRVASHVHNILTSIVQPLDKLDFSEKSGGKEYD